MSGDLDQKKRIYARAGIVEYWVANVKSERLKVFRQPEGENYRSETEYSQGLIYPVAFPNIAILVEKILGR